MNSTVFPLRVAALALALLPLLALRAHAQQRLTPDDVRASVLTIRVEQPKDRSIAGLDKPFAVRVQPGIYLGDGFVLTTFDGLLGADDLVAEVGSRRGTKLKFVGGDSYSDLALLELRTDPKSEAAIAALRPLDALADVQDIRAPGLHVLYRDTAEDRDTAPLPLKRILDGDGLVRATPQSLYLGGCPAVDERGALVGMWVYDPDRIARMVPAAELWSFVEEQRDQERRRKLEEYVAGTYRTPVVMPRLRYVDEYRYRKGQKFISVFDEHVRCSDCGGTGKRRIDRETEGKKGGITGSSSSGQPCADCEQSKLRPKQEMWKSIRKAATFVSGMARNDPDLAKLHQLYEAQVQVAADRSPYQFRVRLQEVGLEELNPARIRPGQAVSFRVDYQFWPTKRAIGFGQEARLVFDTIDEGDSSGPFLLLDLNRRTLATEGFDAMVTGVVSGMVMIDEEPTVVLERSYVMPIRQVDDN